MKKVNPAWVQAQLEELKEFEGDDEKMHSREDRLYREILAAIASGDVTDARECARLALTSQGFEFGRWCG